MNDAFKKSDVTRGIYKHLKDEIDKNLPDDDGGNGYTERGKP